MRRYLPLILIILTACVRLPEEPAPVLMDPIGVAVTPTAANPIAEAPPPEELTCPPTSALLTEASLVSGSVVEPNTSLEKRWTVQNTGNCTWAAGYQLAQMDGPTAVPPADLPPLAPGQAAEVSFPLVVPAVGGSYTTVWQIQGEQGSRVGNVVYFQFFVGEQGQAPTVEAEATDCTPDMDFVSDVTIPDDTVVGRGERFTKVWRVRNTGGCDWSTGYRLVFAEGEGLADVTSVSVPYTPAGGTADLSIEMQAPSIVGSYESRWQVQDEGGSPLGNEVYVRIEVTASGQGGGFTDIPTLPPQPTVDPDQPTLPPTTTAQPPTATFAPPPEACTTDSSFVSDVTIPDGSVVQAGQTFTKTWRVQNSGSCAWNEGYVLALIEGQAFGATSPQGIPAAQPGETVDISVGMTAPTTPGTYESRWQIRAPDGTLFGTQPYVQIVVEGDSQPPTGGSPDYAYVNNITDRARQIYAAGQQRGNDPRLFVMVGDSITKTYLYMTQIGDGIEVLSGHSYLAPTIDYFRVPTPLGGNAFNRASFAAEGGWTSNSIFDRSESETVCGTMVPLDCEYTLIQPSVSIIMLGTNDPAFHVSSGIYEDNIRRAVERSIDYGIIPVLSTIPWNPARDPEMFNSIIRRLAQEYQIPWMDYHGWMETLPNRGLSEDNVHPSEPGDGNTAHFSEENLRYGYTVRNLLSVQMLDALRQEVMGQP